jgi:NTE family protein
VLSPTIDALRQVSVAGRVEELFTNYQNILVQVPRGEPLPPLQTARVVNLADAPSSIPAEERGPRAVLGWSLAAGRTGPDPAGAVFVPEPSEADEASIQRGELSTHSPTGQALGLAARDLAGLKVGLALGGGSNRGYAHMGVLRVLERAGVTVDYLAGTSIGSAAGAGYALGLSPDEIIATFDRIGSVAFRPTIPVRSILSSGSLARLIASTCGGARLEHLALPFAVVAADLETRREVVLRRGRVSRAVMASMAIPGIYPAVRMGGYTLVDGGVLNPVPASAVTAMGADVVIAVKLGPAPAEADLDGLAVDSAGKPPSALAVLLRSLELMQSLIARDPGDAKTIQITPTFPVMSARLRNFGSGRAYVEAGEQAAEAALPRIAAALPWLRR